MVRNNRHVRVVEAEGFYHGVHFVSPVPAEAEIASKFEGEIHEVRHDSVDESKQLESIVALLETREPEAREHWTRLREETQGHAPEVAMPIFATQSAVSAVAGETSLLAPVMDGFGIADPLWQYLTAATLVVVASGLLHLAIRRVHEVLKRDAARESGRGPIGATVTVALALFALATITVLGWWRAGEMIFAAQAEGGEWVQFLRENEVLTKICVTLLTLGLPFFAAIAFEWGFARLRYALEWRRARRQYAGLTQGLETAKKSLEAVTERREHRINALSEQKESWIQAYRENYELGLRIGARKPAAWRVILHIAAVTLTIAACCAVAEAWFTGPITTQRLFLYLCATLGLGGIYAYFVLKAWERPTPLQLYRQRAVIWRDPHGSLLDGSGNTREENRPTVSVTAGQPLLPKGRV